MKTRHSSLTAVVATAGAVVASGTAYALLDYPPCASLGATHEECAAALPGDELIPDGLQSTRAITVQAPPDAVWPWLVQMGQDRGGFYSFDWLERLFGAEIHNADRIHPEWQTLAVGDAIWPYPERKLRAMAKSSGDIGGWRVVSVEPGRALVVQSNAGRWSWTLVLRPIDRGGTRLVARTRFAEPERAVSRAMDALVGQPAHLVMELGVLRGIKARAEKCALANSAQPMLTGARTA
jgi:hypothetical protein